MTRRAVKELGFRLERMRAVGWRWGCARTGGQPEAILFEEQSVQANPSGLLAHRLYWALPCGGPWEPPSPASASLGSQLRETAILEEMGPPSFPLLVQPSPPWHCLLPSTLQNLPPAAPAEAPAPAGPRALLTLPAFRF